MTSQIPGLAPYSSAARGTTTTELPRKTPGEHIGYAESCCESILSVKYYRGVVVGHQRMKSVDSVRAWTMILGVRRNLFILHNFVLLALFGEHHVGDIAQLACVLLNNRYVLSGRKTK